MTGQVDINKVTVVALVENEPGVLNRIASMFRRRAFTSIADCRAHSQAAHFAHDYSRGRGSRVCHAHRREFAKLVNVIDVRVLDNEPMLNAICADQGT